MSDGYQVDIQHLRTTASRLRETAAELKGLKSQCRDSRIFGSAAVNAAFEDFLQHWDYGIDRVSKKAVALAKVTEVAARSYERQECRVSDIMQRKPAPGSASGGGAGGGGGGAW